MNIANRGCYRASDDCARLPSNPSLPVETFLAKLCSKRHGGNYSCKLFLMYSSCRGRLADLRFCIPSSSLQYSSTIAEPVDCPCSCIGYFLRLHTISFLGPVLQGYTLTLPMPVSSRRPFAAPYRCIWPRPLEYLASCLKPHSIPSLIDEIVATSLLFAPTVAWAW